MHLGEALGSYWSNYLVTGTRASRSEYWWNKLFVVGGAAVCGFVDARVGYPAFIIAYSLTTTVPTVALSIRRLHDMGHSGWYALVPVVGWIMCCLRTEQQWNRWGAPAALDAYLPPPPKPQFLQRSREVRPAVVACLCLLTLSATAWQATIQVGLRNFNKDFSTEMAKRRTLSQATAMAATGVDEETVCLARAMRDAVTAMPTATGTASYGACRASVTSEAASGGGRVLHVTDVDARGCMALAAAELGTSNYGTVVNDSLVRDKGVRVADGAKHCTVTCNAVSLYFQ